MREHRRRASTQTSIGQLLLLHFTGPARVRGGSAGTSAQPPPPIAMSPAFPQVAEPPAAPQAPETPKGHYELPTFQWPPPAASASYVLPRTLFAGLTTVGEVSYAIVAALESQGYVEHSFFRTAVDGVALVTRLERIHSDGSIDKGDRWPPTTQDFQTADDLVGFFKGLFYANPGHYRVIVFVLQDLPFSQSNQVITGETARQWLRTGANVLPADVAARPFGDGQCTALIYEFASDGKTVRVVPSPLDGKQHLEKAGLLAALNERK